MYITVKGLTFGKYSSGGDGNRHPAYTSVVKRPNLTVRADVNFEYAEGQDYADGVRIANKRKVTGVSTAFELADLDDDIRTTLLGWIAKQLPGAVMQSGNETAVDNNKFFDAITDQDPNYYGIGFYVWDEEPITETDRYIGIWIYKSRFSTDNISIATSTDQIAYQHQTINGRGVGVRLPGDKAFSFVAISNKFTSENDADSWLNNMSGYNSGSGEMPVEEVVSGTGG